MAERAFTDEEIRRWKEKTDYVPGLASDTDIPEVRFQVQGPQVYTLQVWRDGTTARGQMTLEQLAAYLGQPITKEGWYDHTGRYYGDDPQLGDAI